MNWYDAEREMLSRKATMRQTGAHYWPAQRVAKPPNWSLTYRRALAGLGGRLITLGVRLQSEYAQLAAAPVELSDALLLSPNGDGRSPC